MPKAILSFKLPEEQCEFNTANRGGEYYSMLWEIFTYARNLSKYDDRDTLPKEEVVQKLYETIQGFDSE